MLAGPTASLDPSYNPNDRERDMTVPRARTMGCRLLGKWVGTSASIILLPCAMFPSVVLSETPSAKPNLSGIWQALNEANWNVEPHVATQGALDTLGAIGAVAPGIGVVEGGKIPYLPAA